MTWFKRLLLNLLALSLTWSVSLVVIRSSAYFWLPLRRLVTGPLMRGALVSIVVAMIAPRTRFVPRLAVFTGIYLLDLALSFLISSGANLLVHTYDMKAPPFWIMHGVLLNLFITGISAFWLLKRFRVRIPGADDDLEEIFG
ncbi:hypothetical protein LGH82_31475 [Mesorhizobium sp. PAMC28654]|uniref:hypothetical protein n=1 Tax=Mesorhizobium sp. PAMC28654 TaxID=2880934 RepID=UPI001D0BE56A|nr:hypothetical protein [Mesorhizobium sp. PAMC28654]UDL89523.1 hypothetical protein LGH82_31475 [Mesorhizobium sp. PAMC28654]